MVVVRFHEKTGHFLQRHHETVTIACSHTHGWHDCGAACADGRATAALACASAVTRCSRGTQSSLEKARDTQRQRLEHAHVTCGQHAQRRLLVFQGGAALRRAIARMRRTECSRWRARRRLAVRPPLAPTDRIKASLDTVSPRTVCVT